MKGCLTVLFLLLAASAPAQSRPTGYVSAFVDFFPSRDNTAELRARAFAEQKLAPTDQVRFVLSGFAEGLLGHRPERGLPPFAEERQPPFVRDAIAEVHDASIELSLGRVDLLAGFTRVVWGRLDELQPTDVVNPLDVSRFFFEGRAEARMPVGLVRARLFLGPDVSVEAIYVPVFRRGRFDRLDERTSPFNIVPGAIFGVDVQEPAARWRNGQGGARLSATTGRVDWSVSGYRGFEPFGLFRGFSGVLRPVEERFPRFTMVGADFETVAGAWGIRGELAAVVRDSFQVERPLPWIVSGSSVEGGIGVDRKAGNYRVSGTVVVRREAYDQPIESETSRTDVSVVASADRTFVRERYGVRLFGVYGPSESSSFLRGIVTSKLRDDVALEASAGWFGGGGRDLVGRFEHSDFVYARVKVYF